MCSNAAECDVLYLYLIGISTDCLQATAEFHSRASVTVCAVEEAFKTSVDTLRQMQHSVAEVRHAGLRGVSQLEPGPIAVCLSG